MMRPVMRHANNMALKRGGKHRTAEQEITAQRCQRRAENDVVAMKLSLAEARKKQS